MKVVEEWQPATLSNSSTPRAGIEFGILKVT
jgi:hypothetical protein